MLQYQPRTSVPTSRHVGSQLGHLQLVQPQTTVLHFEQQLGLQCGTELSQWVLVVPQPQLECLCKTQTTERVRSTHLTMYGCGSSHVAAGLAQPRLQAATVRVWNYNAQDAGRMLHNGHSRVHETRSCPVHGLHTAAITLHRRSASSAVPDQPRRRAISNTARAMRGAFVDTYIMSAVSEKLSTRARDTNACKRRTRDGAYPVKECSARSRGSMPAFLTCTVCAQMRQMP